MYSPHAKTSESCYFNRHEYYQKPEEVVLTIFAKGIPAKNVAVDFGEQIVCCLFCQNYCYSFGIFKWLSLFSIA